GAPAVPAPSRRRRGGAPPRPELARRDRGRRRLRPLVLVRRLPDGVLRRAGLAGGLRAPPRPPGRARAVGDPAPPPRRAAAGGRPGQAAAYSTLTRSSGGLSRPKPSCSTRTASSAYLRSITTEMRISEVEIMMMLIPSRARRSNIRWATPAWERIPTPTIDTLATL